MITQPGETDHPPESDGSLDRALDNLEQMLGNRGEDPSADPVVEGSAGDGDRQPELPLLDEVVTHAGPPLEVRHAPCPSPDLSPAEATLYRKLAARLASEIDVIVQTRLEQTMESARREIRKQVKEHIAITLPELIQEAAENLSRDPD